MRNRFLGRPAPTSVHTGYVPPHILNCILQWSDGMLTPAIHRHCRKIAVWYAIPCSGVPAANYRTTGSDGGLNTGLNRTGVVQSTSNFLKAALIRRLNWKCYLQANRRSEMPSTKTGSALTPAFAPCLNGIKMK